jgi:hypothetical protein
MENAHRDDKNQSLRNIPHVFSFPEMIHYVLLSNLASIAIPRLMPIQPAHFAADTYEGVSKSIRTESIKK